MGDNGNGAVIALRSIPAVVNNTKQKPEWSEAK